MSKNSRDIGEILPTLYHLTIKDAAKELGICETAMKKLCRENGIMRWPHRRYKAIQNLMEIARKEGYTEKDDVIRELEQEKRKMLGDYNNKIVKKYRKIFEPFIDNTDRCYVGPIKKITKREPSKRIYQKKIKSEEEELEFAVSLLVSLKDGVSNC